MRQLNSDLQVPCEHGVLKLICCSLTFWRADGCRPPVCHTGFCSTVEEDDGCDNDIDDELIPALCSIKILSSHWLNRQTLLLVWCLCFLNYISCRSLRGCQHKDLKRFPSMMLKFMSVTCTWTRSKLIKLSGGDKEENWTGENRKVLICWCHL